MKKIKYIIILVLLLFSLTSCISSDEDYNNPTYEIKNDTDEFYIPESDNPNGYKITYIGNNDNIYYSTSTKANKAINPGAPNKKCATFKGWFIDSECKNLYDFNQNVKKELTLYAGWDIDISELTNLIYKDTIKANVKIVAENIKTATLSQGSGVIFYEDDNSYYALTNNHVVYSDSKYMIYKAYDCYMTEYECKLIDSNANYDLAIIRIIKVRDKNQKELKVLNFTNYSINENDICISMGDPNGIINTISYGNVLNYGKFNPDKDTLYLNNVQFDVIYSSSYISSGSSGCALLDSNLKIAGIQFASATDQANNFIRSYAIPQSKAIEYINQVFK